MAKQTPYVVKGKVKLTYNSGYSQTTVNVRGAVIWIQDTTEGTNTPKLANVQPAYSDSSGNYVINIADITSSFSDGDKIRVYCKYGDIETFTDSTIQIKSGITTVNFTFVKKSGLIDGAKGTLSADGKHGLEVLGRGPKIGTKDGMI